MVHTGDTDYSRATRLRAAVADLADRISAAAGAMTDPRGDSQRGRGGLIRDAAAIRAEAENLLALAVAAERHRGASWEAVGEAFGVTRQSAHARYGPLAEELDQGLIRYWLDTAAGGCPGPEWVRIPEAAADPYGTGQRLNLTGWPGRVRHGPAGGGPGDMTDAERAAMAAAAAVLIDGLRAQGADPREIASLETGLAHRRIELYERLLEGGGLGPAQADETRTSLAGARARLAELRK